MKTNFIIFICLLSSLVSLGQNKLTSNLPNQWKLSPAGNGMLLGDLPLNLELSQSGKWMAITNNGQSDQSIQLMDVKNKTITDSLVVKSSWFGLAFSNKEDFLYASGGNANYILKIALNNGKMKVMDTLLLGKPWPIKISPTGICIDEKKEILYVVTKENNSLYAFDLVTKKTTKQISLPGEAYQCKLSKNNKKLFVSCWGAASFLVFDTDSLKLIKCIKVGSNPNDFCIDKKELFAYVANANDNSVSVIRLKNLEIVETLNAALYPNSLAGSTTNAVCLNNENNRLYIANADNNCLAVFDITKPGHSKSKGFIPVGWFPTSVKCLNQTLFVANGKGFGSMPNPLGPNPMRKRQKVEYQQGQSKSEQKVQYIGGLFTGTLSIIDEPNDALLLNYSAQVYANCPYTKEREAIAEGEPGNPIPQKTGNPSPIKHVFYIIKENRTYDQVLSDIKGGDGDTSLLLFGENITPNQHAIAKEFVLLDQFFVNGEVSADGHNWSTGAYATDYLEKTWPTSYGYRGGDYDAEGKKAIANNKAGFIWDQCKKKNVSYRTYGEFADDYKANYKTLENHFCPYYTSWDESVFDTTRFYQWKQEFDSLLKINQVPAFNSLRFINDHTEGLRIGKATPIAHVADNDRAVGLFIEYLSKSSIWNESVVFILEDDAQNGPDHIDAHRSTAYVAGAYVKRNFVDHTPYSTASVLRTIELILGLDPMSQYDAAAVPLYRCFNKNANNNAFESISPKVDLHQTNVAYNKWQKMSEDFDFSKEDLIPDELFNQVIWVAVKGDKIPYPKPHRTAFLKVGLENED